MLLLLVAIGILCVSADDAVVNGGIYASRALPSVPRVGFGTAAMGQWTVESVCHALRHGFKLIDTAQAPEWYSEELLGDALRQCWGHRSVNELVIVTKVPSAALRPTHTPHAQTPHTHPHPRPHMCSYCLVPPGSDTRYAACSSARL